MSKTVPIAAAAKAACDMHAQGVLEGIRYAVSHPAEAAARVAGLPARSGDVNNSR